jgi:ankyrin repeat protein
LGQSVVHHAVYSDKEEVYTILQESMLDFDIKDLRGFSPLHLAVGNNSLAYAKCLLGGLCIYIYVCIYI